MRAPHLLAGRAVGVVGLGHIGGSLVRSLRAYRPALQVLGFDRRTDIAGEVSRYATWCGSLRELVERADVVVLAVPIQALPRMLASVAAIARRRPGRLKLIVCDTATVKAPAVEAAAPFADAFHFVALHPFAGRERNGWEASDGRLFRGSAWVVCSGPGRARACIRELVRLAGGTPVAMDARAHDRVIAETIGLPHALAFAAAGSLRAGRREAALQGSSWKSLTRVFASDPGMVAGFLHANASNQGRVLARFARELARLERALGQPTPRDMTRLFSRWQSMARLAR